MQRPKFSVIIPAYNQAEYLAEAIQSVLNQTDPNFELIIINDASSDNTAKIIAQFNDRRIKILTHSENKGLPATRNTGMKASLGELIALLDADDYFHNDKLATHASFFEKHIDVDITYNDRYELHHSSNEIRTIYRPPQTIEIADLAKGFPFSPSDMVFRRSCMQDVGIFDEDFKCGGEDLEYPCRLALAKKRFQGINRPLNFRRFHANRIKKNLPCRLKDYIKALDILFNDPRYNNNNKNLIRQSYANRYLEVACWALGQENYEFGNDLLAEIRVLDSSFFFGQPSKIVSELIKHSIRDINQDHKQILLKVFSNLPSQFDHLKSQQNLAISLGYLRKGSNVFIWNDCEKGKKLLLNAESENIKIDKSYLSYLSNEILSFAYEFGYDEANHILNKLIPYIESPGHRSSSQYLKSHFAVNVAFRQFQEKHYKNVPKKVIEAFTNDPTLITNKGLNSILLKSLFRNFTRKN